MVSKKIYIYPVIGTLALTVLCLLPAHARAGGGEAGVEQPAPGIPAADERQLSAEIEALRKEMKERPADTVANRLGELLLKKGDLDGALQSYDEALRLNPRSFEARTGRGVVHARRGEYDMAEKILRDALVLNPDPARVHYELGLIYEQRGDFPRAIEEYKEGLKKYRNGKGNPN